MERISTELSSRRHWVEVLRMITFLPSLDNSKVYNQGVVKSRIFNSRNGPIIGEVPMPAFLPFILAVFLGRRSTPAL